MHTLMNIPIRREPISSLTFAVGPSTSTGDSPIFFIANKPLIDSRSFLMPDFSWSSRALTGLMSSSLDVTSRMASLGIPATHRLKRGRVGTDFSGGPLSNSQRNRQRRKFNHLRVQQSGQGTSSHLCARILRPTTDFSEYTLFCAKSQILWSKRSPRRRWQSPNLLCGRLGSSLAAIRWLRGGYVLMRFVLDWHCFRKHLWRTFVQTCTNRATVSLPSSSESSFLPSPLRDLRVLNLPFHGPALRQS